MSEKQVIFTLAVLTFAIVLVMPNLVSISAAPLTSFTESSQLVDSWTMTKVVSAESTVDSSKPSLAVGPDGVVHIAWKEEGIVYKRYIPGIGWTSMKIVSPSGQNPSLAVGKDGTVHIVWQDVGIKYRSYVPSFGWTPAKVVSQSGSNPCLAIGPYRTVYVAWQENTFLDGNYGQSCIVSRRLSNSGWSSPQVVATIAEIGDLYERRTPCIGVASDGTLLVVWNDMSDEIWSIYNRRYKPATGWTDVERISTIGGCGKPSLTVGCDGIAHVAWGWAWEDNKAVLHRKYVPGKGWANTEVVSLCDNDWWSDTTPSLAVGADGTVHAAWTDYLEYNNRNTHLFYNKYVPTIGWTVAKVISTESTASSWNPALAVDSYGAAHVAWVDNTDYAESGADADIFYKKVSAGKYVFGVIDKVDIGYPNSEKYHSLRGWGPMWQGYSDINLPKAPFNSYRAAWYTGEGTSMKDRSGSVILYRKQNSIITHAYVRVSNPSIESFDVYAQASWGTSWTEAKRLYRYTKEDGWYWTTHEVKIPESWKSANAIRISIVATGDLAAKLNVGVTDWIQLAGYIRVG